MPNRLDLTLLVAGGEEVLYRAPGTRYIILYVNTRCSTELSEYFGNYEYTSATRYLMEIKIRYMESIRFHFMGIDMWDRT